MNGLLEVDQTSGTDWNLSFSARAYYDVQPTSEPAEVPMQSAVFVDVRRQIIPSEVTQGDLIAKIRREYVLPSDSSVSDFLRRHGRIARLLVEALPHLRNFFGNVILALHTSSDDEGWEMLYVSAKWPGEPQAALEALDRFDDAWWIANSSGAGLMLTFTYTLI